MNDATQLHLSWLQEKLACYESKLSDAESAIAELRPIVLNLRGTIEALTTEGHGPTPQKNFVDDQSVNNDANLFVGQPTITTQKPFTVGNQNPNMPARRPEFATTRLLDAASQIIDNTPNTVHANDVTNSVFIIETKEQFGLAKRSMAAELHRGAKNGLWDFIGENRYRRIRPIER